MMSYMNLSLIFLPSFVQYMEENDNYTVMDMTDYLIKTYREFRGKSRMTFMKSVDKGKLFYSFSTCNFIQ